jgi:hypothetical protein
MTLPDVVDVKASAEISSSGRVGDAAGAQGIEENSVVAAQLDVLQAVAVAQGVDGKVHDVIGAVVGQMDFEYVQAFVDLVDETDLAGELNHGADAPIGQAMDAFTELIVDVACREHRFGAIAELGRVEPAPNLTLAVGQLLAYLDFHSKSLSPWGSWKA